MCLTVSRSSQAIWTDASEPAARHHSEKATKGPAHVVEGRDYGEITGERLPGRIGWVTFRHDA